jgi:tetratricopeptide (TPR) repeat protein
MRHHPWVRRAAAAVLMLAAASVRAQPAAPASAAVSTLSPRDRWADSVRRDVEAALVRGDRPGIAAARAVAERALSAFPDDGLLLHYQGYALWREAGLAMGTGDEDGARPLLEQADEVLERAAKRLALPESHAVRASVLGQLIATSRNPLTGMRLGPKSGGLLDEAERLDARNPRVWLLKGMSAMYTPSMFGGGLDKAEAHLQRARALFAADRPAPARPAWGEAETYAYLGQVHAKRGRADEARAAYQQALALQPDYGWVQHVLLPALARGGR